MEKTAARVLILLGFNGSGPAHWQAAGFVLVRRVRALFLFVPVLTAAVTVVGFGGSFRFDLPTGPFAAVLLAKGAASSRGR